MQQQKNLGPPLPPALCYIWADKGGYFQKLSYGSETWHEAQSNQKMRATSGSTQAGHYFG